jgi:hypothetical protein
MILDTSTAPWTVYPDIQTANGCGEDKMRCYSSTWCHDGETYRASVCCVDCEGGPCQENLANFTAQAMAQWPANC